MKKEVKIEYLYLDLDVCERCVGTDKVLDEVVFAITPVLEMAGYKINYEKIEMTTVKDAVKYKFLSSPTIRVNGQDICSIVKENDCSCCSDISGTSVTCRIFTYEGIDYEVPPKKMLVNGILKILYAFEIENNQQEEYSLPKNLKDFYRGKMTKNVQCCCSDNNCC